MALQFVHGGRTECFPDQLSNIECAFRPNRAQHAHYPVVMQRIVWRIRGRDWKQSCDVEAPRINRGCKRRRRLVNGRSLSLPLRLSLQAEHA